jgi:hypothetical protein
MAVKIMNWVTVQAAEIKYSRCVKSWSKKTRIDDEDIRTELGILSLKEEKKKERRKAETNGRDLPRDWMQLALPNELWLTKYMERETWEERERVGQGHKWGRNSQKFLISGVKKNNRYDMWKLYVYYGLWKDKNR